MLYKVYSPVLSDRGASRYAEDQPFLIFVAAREETLANLDRGYII